MAANTSDLAAKIRQIVAVNPAVTPEQLAQGFGVPVDDINAAILYTPKGSSLSDTSTWDKATLDYYNALQAYQDKMVKMGFNVTDPNLQGLFNQTGQYVNPWYVPDIGVSLPNPSAISYQMDPEAYYKGLMSQYADPSSAYQSTLPFNDPKYGYLGTVLADPNAQYRLVDISGGNKVVYSGAGLDALTQIKALVPQYSKDASSQWIVQQSAPASNNWTDAGAYKPDQSSGFGKWLLSALPTALIPGLAPLLGPAVGSALGVSNTLGGALVGAGIGGGFSAAAGADPLMALLSAGLGGLGGAATTAQAAKQAAAAATAANAASSAAPISGAASLASAAPAASEIVVNAPLVASLANQAGTALGSLGALSQVALDPATQQVVDQYTSKTPLQQSFDATFGTQPAVTPADVSGGLSTASTAAPSYGISGGLDAIDPNAIVVSGNLLPSSGIGSAIGSTVGALSNLGQITQQAQDQTQQTQDQQPNEIVVKAQPKPLDLTSPSPVVPPIPPGALDAIAQTIPQLPQPEPTQPEPAPTDEIVVKAQPKPLDLTGPSPVVPPIPPGDLSDLTSAVDQQIKDAAKDTAKDTTTPKPIDPLKTASTVLKAAGLIAAAVGGGSGSGSGTGVGGTVPTGLAADKALSPVFTSELPEAGAQFTGGLPGAGGATGVGPEGAPGMGGTSALVQNWIVPYDVSARDAPFLPVMPTRQSVMDALARGAAGGIQATNPMAVIPKAHGGLLGYAHGGDAEEAEPSFAVNGPGDGRSDDIPARLSDGEYVMDAETVALLGNGSSKAGAQKLDQMRVNIRKAKGRNLAQGKFSVKARQPEAYLAGGLI